MNYVLGNPLKAKTFSELNVQEYEESSVRETTSFSYFCETAFSLFPLRVGGIVGTGEIVLTRLSLKTNWLLVLCSSEMEGRLQVSGLRFLEGFILKDSRRQIDDRGEGFGGCLGWGRMEINISRRKTSIPKTSRRPPPSPPPFWAERQGRGCLRRLGYIF